MPTGKILNRIASVVAIAAIAACSASRAAQADAGTIIGRVARGGDDSSVRVCLTHDIEVKSGQKFAVVRHTLRTTSPKAPPVLESAHVGVLRIAGAGTGHCVRADILAGSARWLDWVSMQAGT